jgi:hypothetical protein
MGVGCGDVGGVDRAGAGFGAGGRDGDRSLWRGGWVGGVKTSLGGWADQSRRVDRAAHGVGACRSLIKQPGKA